MFCIMMGLRRAAIVCGALIEAAKGAMLANPDIGVAQIAHVSPATLYRYIPAARTANLPDGFREPVEDKAAS